MSTMKKTPPPQKPSDDDMPLKLRMQLMLRATTPSVMAVARFTIATIGRPVDFLVARTLGTIKETEKLNDTAAHRQQKSGILGRIFKSIAFFFRFLNGLFRILAAPFANHGEAEEAQPETPENQRSSEATDGSIAVEQAKKAARSPETPESLQRESQATQPTIFKTVKEGARKVIKAAFPSYVAPEEQALPTATAATTTNAQKKAAEAAAAKAAQLDPTKIPALKPAEDRVLSSSFRQDMGLDGGRGSLSNNAALMGGNASYRDPMDRLADDKNSYKTMSQKLATTRAEQERLAAIDAILRQKYDLIDQHNKGVIDDAAFSQQLITLNRSYNTLVQSTSEQVSEDHGWSVGGSLSSIQQQQETQDSYKEMSKKLSEERQEQERLAAMESAKREKYALIDQHNKGIIDDHSFGKQLVNINRTYNSHTKNTNEQVPEDHSG